MKVRSLEALNPMLANRNSAVISLSWLIFLGMLGLPSQSLALSNPFKNKADLSPVVLESAQKPKMQSLTQLTVDAEKGLQLRDALQWVKQTHPDLRLARLKFQQAEAKLLATQGAFDPKFSGDLYYKRYNSSTEPGKEKDSIVSDSAVSVLTRYGLILEGGYRSARGDLSSTVQPVGEGGEYYANVIMPLLRYRGVNPFNIAEKKAVLALKQAALELQEKELAVQEKAGEVYWEWVAAKRLQQISQQLLDLGKMRVAQVRKRVDAGDLPEILFIETQKEVQKRQAQVAKDTLSLQKASIKLSLALWNTELNDGRLNILPTWTPKEGKLPTPQAIESAKMQESGKLALVRMNPQLLTFPLSQDIAKLEVDLAKQAFIPKLDAYLSPSVQTGAEGIGPALKAGVKYEIPLRNRLGRGKLRIAELDVLAVDIEYALAYQRLTARLEQILAEIEGQYAIYLASRNEWQTNQALERGERIRFEMGDSTLFVLNIRERETAEAFRKVIEAEQAYHQAILNYLILTVQI